MFIICVLSVFVVCVSMLLIFLKKDFSFHWLFVLFKIFQFHEWFCLSVLFSSHSGIVCSSLGSLGWILTWWVETFLFNHYLVLYTSIKPLMKLSTTHINVPVICYSLQMLSDFPHNTVIIKFDTFFWLSALVLGWLWLIFLLIVDLIFLFLSVSGNFW